MTLRIRRGLTLGDTLPIITADRRLRIREASLDRVTGFFPDARFLDDTEILLDPAEGIRASIRTLLLTLGDNPEDLEQEIIDDYWDTILAVFLELRDSADSRIDLDRRRILAGVTKMIYPIGSQPDWIDGTPFTDDLMFVYALHENDAIQIMPLSHLTAHVDRDTLDTAANARIRAYSRGQRQTPSIALLIDACRRNLRLASCEHGYFVAVPSRSCVVIVPATRVDMPSRSSSLPRTRTRRLPSLSCPGCTTSTTAGSIRSSPMVMSR